MKKKIAHSKIQVSSNDFGSMKRICEILRDEGWIGTELIISKPDKKGEMIHHLDLSRKRKK